MLREGAGLRLPGVTRRSAELSASAMLGEPWVGAPLGEEDPVGEAIRRVARRAGRRPTADAAAVLAALRLVVDGDAVELVDTALDGASGLPGWTTVAPPSPLRAAVGYDPWHSQATYLVEYAADDEDESHVLVVLASLLAGGTVLVCSVEDGQAWVRVHEAATGTDVPMPMDDADPGPVLAEVRDLALASDRQWPRDGEGDWWASRLLLHARVREHASPDPSPLARRAEVWLDEGEQRRLLDDFEETLPAGPERETQRFLADLVLAYGQNHLPRSALHWSPEAVEHFLLDWVPRRAVLSPADRVLLPATLRAWVPFALARAGVPPRWHAEPLATADLLEAEHHEAVDDPVSRGPAAQVVEWMLEQGVDLTDQAAVGAAIERWNADPPPPP